MSTAAVLPVKRFPLAKTRLGRDAGEELRSELARAMAADVLDALVSCDALDLVVVVSGEPDFAAAADAAGAVVIDDGGGEPGQSAAVNVGVAAARLRDASTVVCVPGDCPALDPGELRALLAVATEGVTVVPDRHGSGTNALVLTPPDAIEPAFGPDSRRRHEALAAAAGAACVVAEVPSLLFDVDTGDDLEALAGELARRDGLALRTRAVLAGSHNLAAAQWDS